MLERCFTLDAVVGYAGYLWLVKGRIIIHVDCILLSFEEHEMKCDFKSLCF